MGNRAVICFDKYTDDAIGIYLHWDGDRDSVEGFLKATRTIMGDRLGDEVYGRARLVQAITTFIYGNLSIGLGICANLDCDNQDNGVYVVNSATMQIIDRVYHTGGEQSGHHDGNFIVNTIIDRLRAAKQVN